MAQGSVMALRMALDTGDASRAFRREMDGLLSAVQRATNQAAVATAKTIKTRGARDIAGAGHFGARWQDGLTVEAQATGPFQTIITIGHDQKGFRLFEFGGTIMGRPILWIPLSFADPTAKAKDYPGGLFRVDRQGKKPLLLSIKDRKPKFVGVRSVNVPRKFHIRDIAADAMAQDFPANYNRFMSSANA